MIRRRAVVAGLAAGSAALFTRPLAGGAERASNRLATFQVDITPPVGHPLLAGLQNPAATIKERLEARGLRLSLGGEDFVIAALDWCELRNDAYDRLREAIGKAAGVKRERVLLSCIHQHDAPYFDLTAQKLLDDAGLERAMFDPAFFDDVARRCAKAVADAAGLDGEVTHVGVGAAQVERIACNRRVELTPGQPTFSRYSFTGDPAVRDAPEGAIDPLLQTLGFYAGERLLATISVYAVHPMSYYGRGEVSYDFPGMARAMLDREQPDVFHVYASGCSGDVVAARFNEGNAASRLALAERLAAAMSQSIEKLERRPLEKVAFRNAQLKLPPPAEGDLAPDRLKATVADQSIGARERITAALGLSYWQRYQGAPEIDVPAIDLGPATYLVLPAEMFVEYQLAAQKLAAEKRILTAGYGECAPGYIPTEKARREGFVEEHRYCWNQAGAEGPIMAAVRQALGVAPQ